MPPEELDIKHKSLKSFLVATAPFHLNSREEVYEKLSRCREAISEEGIMGPGFIIIQFVTSVKEGLDVELGFPVTQAVETEGLKTWMLPEMEVLSLIHRGPREDIRESYRNLYGRAAERGIISDEFCREVYLSSGHEGEVEIEIQFVIHKWDRLLATNLVKVVGKKAQRSIMQGSDKLTMKSTAEQRFRWTRGAMERLKDLADERQKFEILSGCAHVFPERQIAKLRALYEDSKARTGNSLKAVDAVRAFMGQDPGWGERPRREGNVIFSSKKPRDPAGYEKASDEGAKKKAYCYCPLVREHLDAGMPVAFCYCGAGWYRQQWEGAIGKPVTVKILKSILKGDDRCEFAIRLPDDM